MMSQGLGRPEEKERERRVAGRWSSQNITSLIGGLIWTWVMGTQHSYNGSIKDQRLHMTVTYSSSESLRH